MSETMIKIDHVSKEYRLGAIGGGTLRGDLQSWWARVRGKEDPNLQIGQKTYTDNERFLALDDISFEVKKGEALGIIGHNGAGKSTLLKLLSRVTAPSGGTISYNGRIASMLEVPLTTVRQPKEKIGMETLRLLLKRIGEKESGVPPGECVHIVLETELIERMSVK